MRSEHKQKLYEILKNYPVQVTYDEIGRLTLTEPGSNEHQCRQRFDWVADIYHIEQIGWFVRSSYTDFNHDKMDFVQLIAAIEGVIMAHLWLKSMTTLTDTFDPS